MLLLLVQCFREPLDGSQPETPPGNTQALVGEADPLLDDSRLLSLPGSVQVSTEEAISKDSAG